MSSVQRFAASSFDPCWTILPTEVKAKIVRKLDLSTALALMRCGVVEKDVVREFGKFTIGIKVSQQAPNTMAVDLQDKNLKENLVTLEVQKWEIREVKNGSVVRMLDNSGEVIYLKFYNVSMPIMVFSIVRRIMSDKMFNVMQLKFSLIDYNGPIGFILNTPINVDLVIITRCSMSTSQQILDNEMIKTNTWVVSFPSPSVLAWARMKLIILGYEKGLENMAVVRISPDTIMYSPEDTVSTIFEVA